MTLFSSIVQAATHSEVFDQWQSITSNMVFLDMVKG